MYRVLEFDKSQRLKPYVKFNRKSEENGEKDGKALYKLKKMLCMLKQQKI